MKKYDKSEIMKRAWEIKREDGRNLFAACLEMAWKEVKAANIVNHLIDLGYRVWKEKRIYINNFENFVPNDKNPKGYRKVSVYYDIEENAFYTQNVTSSAKKVVNGIIADIRKAA